MGPIIPRVCLWWRKHFSWKAIKVEFSYDAIVNGGFFPIVSLYFVRLNHHYITSMTAYPVAFPATVVVLHIGVRTLSPPVSFPAKTCVYLVNVLTVMLCAWVSERFTLCIYSYIIGYDIGLLVNGTGWTSCRFKDVLMHVH